MAQQMKNNSYHNGSYTITERDTYRYAVVNDPFCGKHKKPQDKASIEKRHIHWLLRNRSFNKLEEEIINGQ